MDVVAGEGANGFRVVNVWDSGRPAGQVTQAGAPVPGGLDPLRAAPHFEMELVGESADVSR